MYILHCREKTGEKGRLDTRNESVTIVASDRAPVIPGEEKTLEINRGSIRIPCNVEKLTNY